MVSLITLLALHPVPPYAVPTLVAPSSPKSSGADRPTRVCFLRPADSSAASELEDPTPLTLRVAGTAEIGRVEIIRRGAPIVTSPGDGSWELGLTTELDGLAPGDFVYVRVTQRDGGLAWSSPFFIE